MNPDEFFQIGKVVKTSGSSGELIFVLESDLPAQGKKMEPVFILIKGNLVPFFIEKTEARGKNQAIVKLLDIDNQEDALQLTGSPILLPNSRKQRKRKSASFDIDLEDYEVVDNQQGSIGKIINILELPMQEIMEIDHLGKQILIPLVEEIIREVDTRKKIIYISAPEGLIDLYLL